MVVFALLDYFRINLYLAVSFPFECCASTRFCPPPSIASFRASFSRSENADGNCNIGYH